MSARYVLTILAVRDAATAAGFYASAFGLEKIVDTPVYVELRDAAGMRLGLYRREGFAKNTGVVPEAVPPGAIGASELYFHVDDPLAAIAALKRAGARELSPFALRDWGDEAAYFADPDGNVVVVARRAVA
jgi:catechol 2,3-dioxygenase-like lactoylglutathione lyase family enzyme